MKELKEYIGSLFDKEFISTGLKTAIVVGSLLFLINHGAALWRGEMNFERWISALLSYLMPYLVAYTVNMPIGVSYQEISIVITRVNESKISIQ